MLRIPLRCVCGVQDLTKRTRVWGISGEVRGSESCMCHHTDQRRACVVHCGIGVTRVGQSTDGGELKTQGEGPQLCVQELQLGEGRR